MLGQNAALLPKNKPVSFCAQIYPISHGALAYILVDCFCYFCSRI